MVDVKKELDESLLACRAFNLPDVFALLSDNLAFILVVIANHP